MHVTSSFIDRAISGLETNSVWIAWDEKFTVVHKDSSFSLAIKNLFEGVSQKYKHFDARMVLDKLKHADWTAIDEVRKERFFYLFNRATKGEYVDDIYAYLHMPCLRDQEKLREIFSFIRDYGQIGYRDPFGRIIRLIRKDERPCLKIWLQEEVVVFLRLEEDELEPSSLSLEEGRAIPFIDLQDILEGIYQKSLGEKVLGEMWSEHVNKVIEIRQKEKPSLFNAPFFHILRAMGDGECLSCIIREKECSCDIRKVGERHLILEIKWKNRLQKEPLVCRDEAWYVDVSFPLDAEIRKEPVILFTSKYKGSKMLENLDQLESVISSIAVDEFGFMSEGESL